MSFVDFLDLGHSNAYSPNVANGLSNAALDQCFSTGGSRPTFGSRALTFGSPKSVF